MKKALVVLSGGIDSTTLLYESLSLGEDAIYALSVDYGQRHSKELEAAARICGGLGIDHTIVDAFSVGHLIMGGNALTGEAEVPHGHFEDVSMKATVVPNRNMILLAIAGAKAVQIKAHKIFYGAHFGDHSVYPDCRKPFIDAIAGALAVCDYHPIALIAPFWKATKADIVKLGLRCGVPFELTWSCYEGREKACGRCGACVERLEAFHKNDTIDPIQYEDRDYWKAIIQ